MDDVGLDGARLQRRARSRPARPIGADDPPDRPSGLARFIRQRCNSFSRAPASASSFLALRTLRDHSCNEPLRLAHLDHDDQCAILFEGGEGPAGVKRLRQWVTHCRHGLAQEARHAMAQGVTHGSEGRVRSVVPATGCNRRELCRRFGIIPEGWLTNGWLGRPLKRRTGRGIAPGDRMCLRREALRRSKRPFWRFGMRIRRGALADSPSSEGPAQERTRCIDGPRNSGSS